METGHDCDKLYRLSDSKKSIKWIIHMCTKENSLWEEDNFLYVSFNDSVYFYPIPPFNFQLPVGNDNFYPISSKMPAYIVTSED